MRIQHNIMAMNAYRNYKNNTSAVSKNLEKLSSGYKINRAGDDAAGLAISEKMRAQITGLKQAQANAKSGINLVQTAEGAMQEVHDMLNRMVKLADQSANGTYDNEVDRVQLQKEVTQLKDEINRIADSANFNGIKLLDGSLDNSAPVVEKLGSSAFTTGPADVAAVKEKDTITLSALTNAAKGDKITVDVKYLDKDNQLVSKEYSFTVASGGTKMILADGTEAADLGTAIKTALENDGAGDTFTFSGNTATALVAEANNEGSAAGQIIHMNVTHNGNPNADAAKIERTKVGTDKMNGYTGFAAFDGAAGTKAEDYIFTVNGAKFAFATKGNSGSFASDVNVVTLTSQATPQKDDVKEMMMTINRVLGADVARVDKNVASGLQLAFLKGEGKGGLTLQIGDTSDSFNQLKVSIKDMHTSSLGISGVDISTQAGAAAAVDVIKNAINNVSDVRGTLGATQNRLDHTINNLSVMEENIQDAEATIRDTDIAEEMMAYTKNNILVQSAQAMLAQANQIPQGVLQLLG